MLDAMARMPAVHLLLGGLAAGGLALVLLRPGFAARVYGIRWLIARPILAALGAFGFCAVLRLIAPHVPASLKRATYYPRTCAETRAMGFGAARIGEPGYFHHLDAGGDGRSCEPMPRSGWRRSSTRPSRGVQRP